MLYWPWGMWDLSSLTRDQSCSFCIGRWSRNHWTTREVPKQNFRESFSHLHLGNTRPWDLKLLHLWKISVPHFPQGKREAFIVTRDCWFQFSHSVLSSSLRPRGLQHANLPCPSSAPRDYSNSCPSSWWTFNHLISSNHLILCHPLLLRSIFPSIRVFSNESVFCIRWPKYWSFSFSISPSNEYSGLISFRIDWLDLLAIQGTLKILIQHHSSKP